MQNELRRRSLKAHNGLSVITDSYQRFPGRETDQQIDQLDLTFVGILKLVDNNMLERIMLL